MGDSVNDSLKLWRFAWLDVVDDADNFVAYPNYYDPTKLDSWQLSLQIRVTDFHFFDFCTRPERFTFMLNDYEATGTNTPPDSSVLVQHYYEDYRNLRLQTVYPAAELITRENMPKLIIQYLTPPLILETPPPLYSTAIHLQILDKDHDNGVIIDFMADINADFNHVTITDSNSSRLAPHSLSGTFFTVLQA